MNLDQSEKFTTVDKNKVLESIQAFSQQCKQAWADSSTVVFPEDYGQVKNIVVCGMGGSQFTPRTIKEAFRAEIKLPYEIVGDYTLPSYVGPESLVILSSYSGTTEEVISCGKEAIERGAKLTAVSEGGEVKKMVEDSGGVGYFFTPTNNPSGQPRIGAGYMLLGHLGLLFSLKLVDLKIEEVDKAIIKINDYTTRYAPGVPIDSNPAKQLAQTLTGSYPFIITAEFLKGFGNGFANQINETAKNISDPRVISELNHHLLEGLKYPESLHEGGIFVFIKSPLYTDPIKKRFAVTREVVEKNGLKTVDIELSGETRIDEVLEAYTISGFTTYYMAMLKDLDPVAIPWVDYFKEQLKRN